MVTSPDLPYVCVCYIYNKPYKSSCVFHKVINDKNINLLKNNTTRQINELCTSLKIVNVPVSRNEYK